MAALALTSNSCFSRCCSFSLRPCPPHPTYKLVTPIQSKLINPKFILKPAKLVVYHTSDLFDPTAFVTDVMSELFIRKIDADKGSKSSDIAMIGLVVLICLKAISLALRNSTPESPPHSLDLEKEKAKAEKEKAKEGDGLDGSSDGASVN